MWDHLIEAYDNSVGENMYSYIYSNQEIALAI